MSPCVFIILLFSALSGPQAMHKDGEADREKNPFTHNQTIGGGGITLYLDKERDRERERLTKRERGTERGRVRDTHR